MIVRLFGKRITVRKVMNRYGYSVAPRLLVLLASAMLLAFPDALEHEAFTMSLTILGLVTMLYLLYLVFLGLKVS
jgi:hypothetical protein